MRITRVLPDLQVNDLDSASEFYTDYLGLSVEEFNLGWVARFTNPDTAASVQVMTTDATAAQSPVLSIMVDDIDTAYAQAQERNLEIVHPLTTEEWGVTRFFVRAPDGNVMNMVQDHTRAGSP